MAMDMWGRVVRAAEYLMIGGDNLKGVEDNWKKLEVVDNWKPLKGRDNKWFDLVVQFDNYLKNNLNNSTFEIVIN